MSDIARKKGWKELPAGDVLEAGTAAEFNTGNWRSERPVRDMSKCISCYMCWIYCPDSAVLIDPETNKVKGDFDLNFCKGCGICAKVCPPKVQAITMIPEKEAQEKEKK